METILEAKERHGVRHGVRVDRPQESWTIKRAHAPYWRTCTSFRPTNPNCIARLLESHKTLSDWPAIHPNCRQGEGPKTCAHMRGTISCLESPPLILAGVEREVRRPWAILSHPILLRLQSIVRWGTSVKQLARGLPPPNSLRIWGRCLHTCFVTLTPSCVVGFV